MYSYNTLTCKNRKKPHHRRSDSFQLSRPLALTKTEIGSQCNLDIRSKGQSIIKSPMSFLSTLHLPEGVKESNNFVCFFLCN